MTIWIDKQKERNYRLRVVKDGQTIALYLNSKRECKRVVKMIEKLI